MLEHRRVRAADRQVERAARFLPGGKADHRGLGNVGEPLAADLAPAADHRRLDESEFAKGGAANFGDEVGHRARLAAARALIRSAERRLGKECVRASGYRWTAYTTKQKSNICKKTKDT